MDCRRGADFKMNPFCSIICGNFSADIAPLKVDIQRFKIGLTGTKVVPLISSGSASKVSGRSLIYTVIAEDGRYFPAAVEFTSAAETENASDEMIRTANNPAAVFRRISNTADP